MDSNGIKPQKKTLAGVATSTTGNNALYTVPSNSFFEGQVFATTTPTQVTIGGVLIAVFGNNQVVPIKAGPGQTISVPANYGTVYLTGYTTTFV